MYFKNNLFINKNLINKSLVFRNYSNADFIFELY